MKAPNPVNVLKLLGLVFAIPVFLIGLLFLYDYIAIVSGFHDWQDAYHVRHYRLAAGLTLQNAVESRLRSRGIYKHVMWGGTCYGPSSIVTACTNSGDYPWGSCLGFEYYHGDEVVSANSLAAEIIPELKNEPGRHGIALDDAKLDNLR